MPQWFTAFFGRIDGNEDALVNIALTDHFVDPLWTECPVIVRNVSLRTALGRNIQTHRNIVLGETRRTWLEIVSVIRR